MTPLLPDRHPNPDFFVCDVLDAVPKDDMASMEHPVFSLSTKPDTRILTYEHHGNKVEIAPSVRGLATIHDKDVLIYCISQLVAKMNRGEQPSRVIRLKAYDLLVSTNRETSGDGYRRLKESFERLAGTRITTDILTNGERVISGFGLIDAWEIRVRDPKLARMAELEITLSKWMYNAILGREVLTLHRDYFRLRKPMERRMYELARKHCGKQESWAISLELLKKKCGSASTDKEFRRLVSVICREDMEHGHMPDYALSLEGEQVRFTNRQAVREAERVQEESAFPLLDAESYHDARTVAPGYDVYFLEQEWRTFWVESGRPELKSPNAAFIAFCKRRYERNPNP
jgi:plasmid replication initiation protein